jgi:hypothetical protein
MSLRQAPDQAVNDPSSPLADTAWINRPAQCRVPAYKPGDDGAKKPEGRKRHLLVDWTGRPPVR